MATAISISAVMSNTLEAVGTSRWKAPECIGHNPVFDKKTDIRTGNRVLGDCHTRITLCNLQNVQVQSGATEKIKPTIPYECPCKLATLIQQCWSEPATRPSADKVLEFIQKKLVSFNGALLNLFA
jgi:hypothetical protein